MRRLRNGQVQTRVRPPRRVVIRSVEIGLQRLVHGLDVAPRAASGRCAGDQRLDQIARVEDLLEFRPVGHEVPPNMDGGCGAPAGADEIAPETPSAHLEIAGVGDRLEGLPYRGSRDAKHDCELTLGRQLLAGHVETEPDGRHEPVDDVVRHVPAHDRRAPCVGDEPARGRGGEYLAVRPQASRSRPPKRARRKRLTVRAASTMLCKSTDSSTPCIL